jgi:hypothetical protein
VGPESAALPILYIFLSFSKACIEDACLKDRTGAEHPRHKSGRLRKGLNPGQRITMFEDSLQIAGQNAPYAGAASR